jgi:hypothetical protein
VCSLANVRLQEKAMSHQGNISLSYNLVLVVQVADSFMAGDDKAVLRRIRREACDHLKKRFNKKGTAATDVTIARTFAAKVRTAWIKAEQPDKWGAGITPRDPTTIGTVYVLLLRSAATAFGKLADDMTPIFRKCDPEVHVEYFHIDLPSAASDDKRLADALYHLASRICASFVEYRPLFTVASQTPPRVEPMGALAFPRVDGRVIDKNAVVKKILDVRDAVDLVCEGLDGSMHYFPPVAKPMQTVFEGRALDKAVWVRYKFPFGVWFRGQARVCYSLGPSLFRETAQPRIHQGCNKLHQPDVMYDESSMVYHFMLTKPEFRREYQDLFEWLCLMQHYNAPSRVLDWTENLLMAVYFAVCEVDADCDGAVWVLNAGRLNEITRATNSRRYACFPNSTDVVLRSAMAVSHTGRELKTTLVKQNHMDQLCDTIDDDAFFRWLDGKAAGSESRVWNRLAWPVAVYPPHANDRLANQPDLACGDNLNARDWACLE